MERTTSRSQSSTLLNGLPSPSFSPHGSLFLTNTEARMPQDAPSVKSQAPSTAVSSSVHTHALRRVQGEAGKEADSDTSREPSPDRAPEFVSCRVDFGKLLGPSPRLRLLLRDPQGRPIFHEAGIYHPTSQSVWLSTNRMPVTVKEDCSTPQRQTAAIVRVDLSKIPSEETNSSVPAFERLVDLVDICEELPAGLAMPNGATKWTIDSQESVLWCEQGRHAPVDSMQGTEDVHSALVAFTPHCLHDLSSASTSVLLDHYKGKRFSSLNDVVVHEQSGVVFFTDPDYGVGQNFKRPRPSEEEEYAPNALYAWYPPTGEVRMVDDRCDKPNGVTFIPSPTSPETGSGLLCTTDTGACTFTPDAPLGTFHLDASRPLCIYTYRVEPAEDPERDPFPRFFVEERRLLAHSEYGAPDGVHPDEKGHLWVGSGDGVHIYDPWCPADGKLSPLIGKIVLPTGKGVANFCWAGLVAKQPGHGDSGSVNVAKEGGRGEDGGATHRYRLLLFAEDELWEAHVGVNGRD